MERLVTKLEEAAMTMNSLEESLSNSGNASKAKKEDPFEFQRQRQASTRYDVRTLLVKQ